MRRCVPEVALTATPPRDDSWMPESAFNCRPGLPRAQGRDTATSSRATQLARRVQPSTQAPDPPHRMAKPATSKLAASEEWGGARNASATSATPSTQQPAPDQNSAV